jgi:hypothetical protein
MHNSQVAWRSGVYSTDGRGQHLLDVPQGGHGWHLG